MYSLIKVFLSILFLLFAQTAAFSGNCTGTITVSAKIIPECIIKPSTLILQAQHSGTSTLESVCCFDILCTNGSNVSILLNKGENAAYSGVTTRAMQCDKNYVSYDLYSDAACKNIWDENYPVTYSSKSGFPFSMKIYAKVYLDSNIHSGIYKDKVMISPTCPGAIITPGILDVILIVP